MRKLPYLCWVGILLVSFSILITLTIGIPRINPQFDCLDIDDFSAPRQIIDIQRQRSIVLSRLISRNRVWRYSLAPDGNRSLFLLEPPEPEWGLFLDTYTKAVLLTLGTWEKPDEVILHKVIVPAGDMGLFDNPFFSAVWVSNSSVLYTWTSASGKFYMTQIDAYGHRLREQQLNIFEQFVDRIPSENRYFATATVQPKSNVLLIRSAIDWKPISKIDIGEGIGNGIWSHKGDKFLFKAVHGSDVVVKISIPETNTLRPIENTSDSSIWDYDLSWSPDDRWITVGHHLYFNFTTAYKADGSDNFVINGSPLYISFDERKFAYLAEHLSPGLFKEWKAFSPASNYVDVARYIKFSVPNPQDANRYAVVSDESGDVQIATLVDVDGQNRVPLLRFNKSDSPYPIQQIDWSPDGTSVVVSSVNNGKYSLVWFNLDGTIIRDIPDAHDWKWLQKGQMLAFLHWTSNVTTAEAYTRDTKQQIIFGESRYRIVFDEMEPYTDELLSFWWESADGQSGADIYTPQGNRIYRAITTDQPSPVYFRRKVNNHPQSFYRSPDNRFVYKTYDENTSTNLIGEAGKIVSLPVNDIEIMRWSHCDITR